MTKQELLDKTDKAISELVYEKSSLKKAYNYYNGVRDSDLFRYLEEAFGLNTPTAIHFTPLIKKHIDAIIGEYLGMPILPKVFCKDAETLTNIDREKHLKILSELHSYLSSHLKNSILNFVDGKNMNDSLIELQLKRIVEDINTNFISEYEIAAQNVIEYIMLSRDTDIITALRDLLLDLLITGYTFYKVEPSPEGDNIKIRVLNPLDTFIDRNYDSPYVKNSYRAVVRTWMTKTLILNKYGKDLSTKDRKELEEKWGSVIDDRTYYVKLLLIDGSPQTRGLLGGVETHPDYPDVTKINLTHELIPVYEVEWLETDKDFIMQRYESVRIGEDIYILKGKSKNVIRSKSNPSYCGLSINGVYFLNRGIKPYSMMLACAHLLDQYDILIFYRDNLIANSGTVGDWIDLTLIPAELGVTLPERLVKWLAYKKQGLGILNSAQEGRLEAGQAPLNTIFNGYDNTVKTQAVEAIQVAIEAIEKTASDITGVFRERLGGILQRDAVNNILQGVNNSFIITKLIYHLMDLIINELLLDSLNQAKITFKKGLTGTLILGDKYQKVFTALPEHFTISDHDIRIITSSDIVKDLEQIKALIPEFIKSGGLPPDILIEAVTSKSIPDIKLKIRRAIQIQKDENNLILQLALQNEELLNQLKELQKQLQQAQQQVDQYNQAKIQIEQQKVQMDYKVDLFKAQTDRTYKTTMADTAKERTEIEKGQLYDNNPYNDKVRQIGS